MKKIIILLCLPFFLLVTSVSAEENNDLQEEIIYDILIDRFNVGNHKSNELVNLEDPLSYHGGDLPGVTAKLDYIDQLGFTTIVLSSLMENAPNGYHGYWIEDAFSIEEEFGTVDDLKELIEEAHKRDIKVVLELVTNYVATSHPFVTEEGKEDWFKSNTVEQIPATEWLDDVMVLDQDNPEVVDYLIEVADYWLDETDIDGFKLHDADQSSVSFLTKLTDHILELDPNLFLMAGVSSDGGDVSELQSISGIQGIENYDLLRTLNDVFTEEQRPVSDIYEAWVKSNQSNDLIMIDNQKTARYANNTGDHERNAFTTWKLALTYMYTMPGTPVVYQGSELPMYGPGFPENQMLVQFNSPDPDLEEFFERISALRKEFPALTDGDYEMVDATGGMTVFKRSDDKDDIYIAINNDIETKIIPVTDVAEDKQLRGILGDNLVRSNEDGDYLLNVPRESSDVFIVENDSGINWLFIGLVGGIFILFVIAVMYLTYKQKRREAQ